MKIMNKSMALINGISGTVTRGMLIALTVLLFITFSFRYAVCEEPSGPPKGAAPFSGVRTAIFPSKFGGTGKIYLYYSMGAIQDVILKDRLFVPLFSYYDLGKEIERKYDVRELPREILPDRVVKNVWIKESFFSGWTPNIELVSTLGRQLQVDAIIMYYIDVVGQDPDPGTVVCFIVDVNTKKVYHAKDNTRDYDNDGGRLNYNLTWKVFSAYNR